jgi:heat-inducible transcriptional repressor
MTSTELTTRERQVFLAIVHGFIQNAEPVGSRYISKHFDLSISPATIRNVMTDLEEKGLICQPHTSAGRIPTTHGYRAYVDSLQRGEELSDDEQRIIVEKLKSFSQDVEMIVSKTANVLGEISSLLGIVLSPRFFKGRLNKIELIQISSQKVLLILSIASGLVKTVIIEIDREFSSDFIMETAQIINERLHGLSVEQLTACFDERFNDLDDKSKTLIGAIKEKTGRIFQHEPEGEFYFSGAKNVIINPEFDSAEKIGKILELLDRKDILVRILSEHHSSGVSIVIGEENSEELMRNCSLITTTYQIDGAIGTLGIVGPTRMQYAKIISLVQFMSETLNYLVSKTN